MSRTEFTLFPTDELSSVLKAVRKAVPTMDRDLTVTFRGGDYYLEQPLVLDAAFSGRNGHRVVFRSSPGERAVLHGGARVGWWEPWLDSPQPGTIFRTKLTRSHGFNSLYVGGRRAVCARYPKKVGDTAPRGQYQVGAFTVYEDRHRHMGFAPGDLPRVASVADLQIYLWPGEDDGRNWHQDTLKVTTLDYEKGIVSWDQPSDWGAGKGSRYFIQGALELLTEPGEYYHDRQAGYLYYWPREGEDLTTAEVVTPLMPTVFCLKGTEAEPVRNVTLEGLSVCDGDLPDQYGFTTVAQGLVYLENAEGIVVQGCEIANSGWHGIHLFGRVRNNEISGNDIHHSGHTGIQIEDLPRGGLGPYRNSHARILNNRVFASGEVVGYASSMELIDTGHNHIAHNRLEHSPRYALGMSSMSHDRLVGKTAWDGRLVDMQNVTDYQHSRNNVIEYNDLLDANRDSQDTGILETWCPGTGNVFHANYLHDSNIYFSFGTGLYLDDCANDLRVTDNLICGLQKEGSGSLGSVVVAKGIGDTIENNVLVDNLVAPGGGALGTTDMALRRENHHQSVRKNLFVRCGANAHVFSTWDDDRYSSCNRNLYWAETPMGVTGVDNIPEFLPMDQWQACHQGLYDGNSLVEDPGLMDAASRDYRLRYDSRAHLLGIHDPDYRAMGLKSDFPRATADTLDRLFLFSSENPRASFVRLERGEALRLQLSARTARGFLLETLGSTPVDWQCSDSRVAQVRPDGTVQAVSGGVAMVTAQVRNADSLLTARYHVLVDDAHASIEILVPRDRLAVGETLEVCAAVKSRRGGYYPEALIVLVAAPVGVVQIGEDNRVTALRTGVVDLTLSAHSHGGPLFRRLSLTVVATRLTGLRLELDSPLLTVGKPQVLQVWGVDNTGAERPLLAEEAAVHAPDFAVVRGRDLLAEQEGEGELVVHAAAEGQRLTARIKLTAVEDRGLPLGWAVSHYRDAAGAAFLKDGRLMLISNGDNVWFQADDATVAYRRFTEVPSRLECRVTSLKHTSPNAQIGLMVRQADTADAACVNFRVNSRGECMVAYRRQAGQRIDSLHGVRGSLPAVLRMEREGSLLSFWYREDSLAVGKSKPWIAIGTLELSLAGPVLAGFAVFSNNKASPTTGILDDLILEGDVL